MNVLCKWMHLLDHDPDNDPDNDPDHDLHHNPDHFAMCILHFNKRVI